MFTEQEKARICHFLGYPRWSQLSASIQLGFPAGAQPLYLLEQAFQRLMPEGEDSVRADLCQCEAIECQMGEARSRMKAESIGNLKMQPRETAMLRAELEYWRTRLGDDLGCAVNPYSQDALGGAGAGGINARVVG